MYGDEKRYMVMYIEVHGVIHGCMVMYKGVW